MNIEFMIDCIKNTEHFNVKSISEDDPIYRRTICPICGNETLDSYWICDHCGWEHDGTVEECEYSSPNHCTLGEYKAEYQRQIKNIERLGKDDV